MGYLVTLTLAQKFALWEFKGLFGFIFFITQFPSLVTRHLSLITHHSSLNFSHPFGIITQFPSLNIFHTICGPIPVSRYSFFFFFLLQYPNSPKLIYIYIYIYINRTEDRTREEKKKEPNSQPRKKKKIKVVKSCNWYCLQVLHVCLITKMPLSYELWKLKTHFGCFQFP